MGQAKVFVGQTLPVPEISGAMAHLPHPEIPLRMPVLLTSLKY